MDDASGFAPDIRVMSPLARGPVWGAPPSRLTTPAGLYDIAPFPLWKRIFDILAASAALLLFAPIMTLVAIMVRLDGGPAIFAHTRIGSGGQPFKVFKFRSMFTDAGVRLNALLATNQVAQQEWARDHKLRNDPRITRIGAFLRKSSLDELPQLFNVLRGEMSIVGPRPIVNDEVARYGRYFTHYCSVRPGITGLWQVSGRNDVSYRRRVALDVVYARAGGAVGTDMRIVVMTIPAVLLSRGSY